MKSAALLAVAAQLAFVMFPVLEGRLGVGLGPHVEASSAGGHYAHDEGRCVACHAQSIHGILQDFLPLGEIGVAHASLHTAPPRAAASAERFPTQSRAPPALS